MQLQCTLYMNMHFKIFCDNVAPTDSSTDWQVSSSMESEHLYSWAVHFYHSTHQRKNIDATKSEICSRKKRRRLCTVDEVEEFLTTNLWNSASISVFAAMFKNVPYKLWAGCIRKKKQSIAVISSTTHDPVCEEHRNASTIGNAMLMAVTSHGIVTPMQQLNKFEIVLQDQQN